ncbi:hypothetical protein L1987_84164 [Smallanthus sonchifolius]|uniref:Uncharacterized protein n=1 Tax=Smallanthus sonchifolius TaxID=185202 RepID=A0ACB8YDW4_9ASTR|nr:hypothetical protein L1987_84164 [Smallanthus sonchifolius]
MEKSDTQPHGLTNTKFPSQFAFTPPKENSIRLFGKEFGGNDTTVITTTTTTTTTAILHENKETQRTFECHYCNRNFPTSQALGGHQNAHRRERFHAKRTHIPSIVINHSASKPQLHAYSNHQASPPYHHRTSTSNIIDYNNYVKLYGDKASYTSNQAPIYGRPLPASRFPISVQKLTTFNRGQLMNYSNTGSSSRRLYMHESNPTSNDQVRLDLHL